MNRTKFVLSVIAFAIIALVSRTGYGQALDKTSVDISIGSAKQMTEKDPDTGEERVTGYQIKVLYRNLTDYGIKADALIWVSDVPERNDPISSLAYLLSNIRDAGGQGKLAHKDDKIRLKPGESLTRTYFFEIKWQPNNKQSDVSLSNFERARILERLK